MNRNILLTALLSSFCMPTYSQAQSEHQGHEQNMPMGESTKSEMPDKNMDHSMMDPRDKSGAESCQDMEFWDATQGMCLPLPMAGMPQKRIMVHGNAFAVGIFAEKPRGRDQFAAPNMIMGDFGQSAGGRHFLNVNLMLTFEKWTYSKDGYTELAQIGEENNDGKPYIDGQHPHSSPIMGLTFSDTLKLGEGKDHVRFFFAPRGQATDGPVAFMHRPTGMANPDAPLGHHLAQDVGHITSTVLGTGLTLGDTTFEVSTFHGEEPKPDKVDLPIGNLDSYAARLIQIINPQWTFMTSAAYVKSPEGDERPDIDHNWRYSASAYFSGKVFDGWRFHNTFIYGLINFYDNVSALSSVTEEFLFRKKPSSVWGRVEYVQRTASQLAVASDPSQEKPRDVYAMTLGYTHDLKKWKSADLALGASITKTFLPSTFETAYAGDPMSGRIFLQLSGMKMWDLSKQQMNHKEM